MRSGSKKVQDSMGKMTHLLDENISGSDLVKIYHAQENEQSKFLTSSIQFANNALKSTWQVVLTPQ